MTTHASTGPAGPTTPAGDRHGGRSHGAAPAAVRTRAGQRRSSRDLWALAAALAGPLAASGVLLPFRASWSNTNVALLLVVVVVAVAAIVLRRESARPPGLPRARRLRAGRLSWRA